MDASPGDFVKSDRRQRKKQLINEVKDLLEFYFSAANLKKDTFMNNLLAKDSYIDLNIFHRFNKIKQLTDQISILQKAVNNSEVLELSEDQWKVKRKVPVVMKENEQECTVYVENLPPNSTHEWIKKVFSPYGVIDYISLPRFHYSGLPKGFAFIEFQTEEQAQEALYAFGGLASLDGTLNPSELRSVQTFSKDSDPAGDQSHKYSPDAEVFVPNPIKRTDEEAFINELDKEEPTTSQSAEKETTVTAPEEGGKKKKKRKKNKKEKEYVISSIYLRVMSKEQWKALRNQYLDTQRQSMRELKMSLNDSDLGAHYSQQIHGQRKRKFTEIQEENRLSNRPEYIPDVIVKLTLSEELEDNKEFRTGLISNHPGICYIDSKEGKTAVHIRFKTAEDAKNFLDKGLFNNVTLLKEDEESCYWSQIFTLWELRRTNPRNKKVDAPFVPDMKRGRDKIVNRALNKGYSKRQHQHFD